VVALATGQVAGFEALARWKHPELGMVPPSRFIPVAEETGLIAELGLNILREACQGMRLLQVAQQRPLNLAVNLSAPQLFRPGLVDDVAQVLGDTGMDPAFLQIEVTESVLVDRIDEAADVLRRLRKMRVRIAMDDFGTGYSSLAYLHALPIDVLKIDRSFVSVLGEAGGRAERLVQSIVALGRSLELEVIAEGVETAAQRTALERLGCELAQGYHFSEAVPLADACALLQSPLRCSWPG
jgi:EAL domain-containing protein (putative c-di-GMP-specific phosphodiesterase class I)